MRLTVVTCLFQGSPSLVTKPNLYNPEWVNKLYRGVFRNLDSQFRFLCLVDQFYSGIHEDVVQVPLLKDEKDWFLLNQIFRPHLHVERGLFMGLDTVITGPLDDIVAYRGTWAWLRNPLDKKLHDSNAVLCWDGRKCGDIWSLYLDRREEWRKDPDLQLRKFVGPGARVFVTDLDAPSEMLFWRRAVDTLGIKPQYLDDLYPGQVVSYNVEVARKGITRPDMYTNARVFYFSGTHKPSGAEHFVRRHWV